MDLVFPLPDPVDLVVLGEPSDNKIALGHRGIAQMWVQFNGRSAHASVPEKAVNPNYSLAQFIQDVQAAKGELSAHELLGPTTISPTIIEVDTKSTNVTPAWARVCLDFRTASESLSSLRDFVKRLVGDQAVLLEDAMCTPPTIFPDSDETIYGFYTPPTDETVQRAQSLISAGMGREAELSSYQFATDGRHFVPYGLTMIGYAASEEGQAHVVDEFISIPKMMESLRGHVKLLENY